MKKTILTIGTVVLIAVGSISFIGCGNAETEHSTHMDGEEHTMYQCPMKCEADKMYEEAGSCPVCGMDLKEVE